MEYSVKAETKEGDVITLRRGFPSRSDAEDYPVRLSLWRRVWVERELSEPNSSLMTYGGIDYAIRAGLGRNERVLLISLPDNVGGNPSVVNFSGSRNDALAGAKKRINNWMKRLKKKRRAACSRISAPNSSQERAPRRWMAPPHSSESVAPA